MDGPDDTTPRSKAPGTEPDRAQSVEAAFEWTLQLSRGMVLLPVAVLVLAALGAFVYGTGLFIWALIEVVTHPFPVKTQIGYFLLDVDLFLVGATLLIAAIGLYELFISRVNVGTRLPGWLVMNDLNDLKARVVSMLVLVTAVSFVDVVVDFQGGHDILFLGGAVALVIVALTGFLRFGTARES